ncbi:MAG: hypothetical protein K0R54_233 [Clostridiaceae bacterium]|jgi:hypothetical protein|nr:hypothetical protein [Clostridiaceae bacterium]
MKKKYSQQEIMDLINKYIGDDEISSNQYPNTVEELKNFLSENEFDFDEIDFLALESKFGFDDDGFPYFKQAIIIMPVNVEVEIIAYHHDEWDFYIESVSAVEDNAELTM